MSETNLTPAGQTAPAEFDYSVLDADTAEKLRGITECVCELQQSYAWGMAYQVGRAHDLLCGGGSCLTVRQLDKKANGNRGDATFTAWCDFIGISRPTAYNLLNAYTLICDASPEQQKNLQLAPAKLLYAAGKKDAPADLVQAVKDGDITTHKQYQELLKENQQLRADRVNALNRAQAAESQRDAAMADVNGLHEQNDHLQRSYDYANEAYKAADAQRKQAENERDKANARTKEAELQLDGARQVAEAAKMRADKWQKEVEAAKAQPVEAVVDEEEIDRRAHKLAADLAAPLQEELDALKACPAAGTSEDDLRNAYDSLLLVGRSMQNAWKSVKPQLQKLPPDTRAGAINQLNNTLTEIQTEAMKCL